MIMLNGKKPLFWAGFGLCNLGLFLLLLSVETYPVSQWNLGFALLGLGILLCCIGWILSASGNKSNQGDVLPGDEAHPAEHRYSAFFEAAAYWIILFGAFVGLLFIYRLDEIKLFTDTRYYAGVASQPLFSAGFWSAERPVGLPLLYKFFGITADSIGARTYLAPAHRLTQLQLLVSWGAFALLGFSVVRRMKNRVLRILSFALVMALGLGVDVSQWNKALLTESFATSTFVILIGLWILGTDLWTRWEDTNRFVKVGYAFLLFSMTGVYASLRDTHNYLLLFFATLIASIILVSSPRRQAKIYVLAIYGVFLVGTFFLQNYSASLGERWTGPFSHVLYLRLLRDERSKDFMLDAGLPVENKAEDFFQGSRRDFERMLAEDESGKPILDWIRRSGRASYMEFLLRNPWYSVAGPIRDLNKLVSPDSSEYRARFFPEPGWVEVVRGTLYPRSAVLLGVWFLLLLAVAGWLISKSSAGNELILPLFLLFASIPMAFLIWHGDAIEVERHAQQLHLQIRLGLWILTMIVLDRVLFLRSPQDADAG